MADKERVGRFLRTLVGLFTVAWLLVALVVPPDPFTFLLWLVPAWVVAAAVAAWLVFGDGDGALRASGVYDPRAPASRATVVFVGLTVVLKLLLTLGADFLLGVANVGHAVGVATSAVAVGVAYAVVFWAGALGRLRGTAGSPE